MNTDKINKYLAEWYERNEKEVRVLMHTLWAHPEVALKEYYACDTIVKFLQQQGFVTIETHAAENWKSSEERPNTVIASWGHGKPVIGIVGELDALPNLGNENVPRRQALEGPGHACGHNLMGGGAAAAASALRYAMEKEELHGTIRLIEAPAEEIGVGKAYLAKNGVFSDLDMALMWHPAQGKLDISPVNQTVAFRVEFSFYGKSAHASGMPWEGRSALDAVQLMNLGCEFMREHIKPHVRVHYYIPNGGSAPNIVPDYASVVYMFRALDDYGTAENVMERAVKCAEGAALMTETEMEYKVDSVVPQFYYNYPLCQYHEMAVSKVPELRYTEEEYDFARELYKNINKNDLMIPEDSELLPTGFIPFNLEKKGWQNCTDAANMTYFCPTIHCQGLGRVTKSPGHHWNVTAVSGSSLGETAGIYAYKTLAQLGYDALTNPEIVEKCWEAHRTMNIPRYKEWI